jgi:hypothetical protein
LLKKSLAKNEYFTQKIKYGIYVIVHSPSTALNRRTSWLKPQSPVRIPAETPTVLTESSREVPSSLQASTSIVPSLPSTSVFYSYSLFRSYIAVLFAGSLNELQIKKLAQNRVPYELVATVISTDFRWTVFIMILYGTQAYK